MGNFWDGSQKLNKEIKKVQDLQNENPQMIDWGHERIPLWIRQNSESHTKRCLKGKQSQDHNTGIC